MTDEDSFYTIAKPSEGEYREKGSKFFAFAYPVQNEEEVEQHLEELKKKYHDSRHVCYAYLIGKSGDIFKAQDDGEPSHSAGDPILNQIKSHGVVNTFVAVVRYFGGTKLGKSGLINAYKTSAQAALQNSEKVERYETGEIQVQFPYDKTSEVMLVVDNDAVDIIDQEYMEETWMKLKVRKSRLEDIRNSLKDFIVTGNQ